MSNGWGSSTRVVVIIILCVCARNVLRYETNGYFSKQLKPVRQEHGQMALNGNRFFSIHLNITVLIKANKMMSRR